MRFAGRFVAVATVAVLALTGCATVASVSDQASTPPDGAPTPDSTPIASVDVGDAPDPLGLVNLWRVSGADGEGANTWLRVDAVDFQLWRDCGMVSGSWRTTGHLFEASTSSASAECAATMDVAWLQSVASFRATTDGWELIDSASDVVATLTVDGAPAPIASAAVFFTEPPVITDATRETLRQPAALPKGLVPATADDLAGRWEPVVYNATNVAEQPYVYFAENGTWKAADGGCGGGVGSWAADGHGAFIAPPASVHSLMDCAGADVSFAVEDSRLVAIDEDVLRLLDIDGIELMQLERAWR